MHELGLHDNKEVQLFTPFNTIADTQCKMTTVFFFHVKFTLECSAAVHNVVYGVDVLKYFKILITAKWNWRKNFVFIVLQ